MSFNWDAGDNVERLRKMALGRQLSAAQMARILAPDGSLSRNAVVGKMNRMGIAQWQMEGKPIRRASDLVVRQFPKPRVKGAVKVKGDPLPSMAAASAPEAIGPIDDLAAAGACRWIADDPLVPGWRMCGHPAIDGGSWCAFHVTRMHAKPSDVRYRHPAVGGKVPRASSVWNAL